MSSKTLLHGLTRQKNKKTSKAFMQSSLREGFFETSDSEISIIMHQNENYIFLRTK